MIYVLDASAIIAWLRNEPGADVVDNAVRDVNAQCLVHSINLCEVFYDARRNAGETHAQAVVSDLASIGVVERSDFDPAFWMEAGRLKAGGGISLAD
jgi:PIN domain nuclease of toxin-antitoxin system